MSERITITDGSLSVELDRWLMAVLQGDAKGHGLYHTISHSVPTWDTYNITKGMILAYESVREKMNLIARERGDAVEEQVVITRAGLN